MVVTGTYPLAQTVAADGEIVNNLSTWGQASKLV